MKNLIKEIVKIKKVKNRWEFPKPEFFIIE